MTVREFILEVDRHAPLVVGALAALPASSFLLGRLHEPGHGEDDPWRKLYAFLIYAACVPGMFSLSLVGYSLLLTRESLLDASIVVYFAPVVAMILSLAIMSHNVDFDRVPGFDKIWGLLGVLAMSFLSAMFFQKVTLHVVFLGGMTGLLLMALAVFVIFRVSLRRLLGPGSPARP